MSELKERYHLLDMFRGICILLVVIYHTMFNLTTIFDLEIWMFDSALMEFLRAFFVACLAVISGISCSLTRSNAKRGLKTMAAALLITLVTYFAMPEQFIVFGILHFFGAAMLIYAILEPLLKKVPTILGLIVCIVLFALTFDIYYWTRINTSSEILDLILSILGFDTGLVSADYYPILPWIFVFLAGGFLGRAFKKGTAPKIFKANPVKFLSFIGRHTLLVYLVHQPIVYGGMYLWFELFC